MAKFLKHGGIKITWEKVVSHGIFIKSIRRILIPWKSNSLIFLHIFLKFNFLKHGVRWFSPGTPASSTTKTGRHDIAEILLKVALNTKQKSSNPKCKLTPIIWSCGK
jgi:hypothetical protein